MRTGGTIPVRPLTEDSSIVNKQAAICLSSSFASFVILSIRGYEKRRKGAAEADGQPTESKLIRLPFDLFARGRTRSNLSSDFAKENNKRSKQTTPYSVSPARFQLYLMQILKRLCSKLTAAHNCHFLFYLQKGVPTLFLFYVRKAKTSISKILEN